MRQRQTIQISPSGLVNTGGQSTIPETAFWEARNCTLGPDGRMSKRPGLRQHGQILKEPTLGGFGWQEVFNDLSHFQIGIIGSDGHATIESVNGVLESVTTSVTPDVGAFARRNAQPNDGTIVTGEENEAALRLLLRTAGELPAQSGTTQPNGFHIVTRSDHTNLAVFLFLDDGIYYWNGTAWTVMDDTDIDDGSWHVIEFRLTSATTASVYIDETLRDSVTFASFISSITLANERFAVAAETNANGTYHVEIDLAQYRSGINDDGTSNIEGVPITHMYEWVSPNPIVRHLLVVAGSIVYDDPEHNGVFRAVTGTSAGALTLFTPFGENLLFINPRVTTRLWSGVEGIPPVNVPATMPAAVYVATQHQGRAVVVSEENPLRVYVGGANTLEDWTTEDLESATGESFTFTIPDAIGQKVTLLVGDHYGQLMIFTNDSVYALIGNSIDTYYLRLVSSRIGCQGPRAFARVGGDILFLSKHGLHSLQAVQEYGDLSSFYLTKGLRNLWQRDSWFDRPKLADSYFSSVVHAAHLGRTFFAAQDQTGTIPNRFYELNHDVSQWTGPWELDCQATLYVLLGMPTTPSVLFGDTSGRVLAATDDRKMDYGTDEYTMRLRSARLDGRSVDPALSKHTKRWRALRLYIIPKGGYDVIVTYTADGHDREGNDSPTQNVYRDHLLDTTFVLDSSETVDAERVGVIDIPFDFRGKWFEFTVEQSGLEEDLVILRAEVDFLPSNDDREN